MLFSSFEFICLFLPLSLLGYQLLSRFGHTALLSWLAVTSLAFYGFWNPAYLILLCGSILANYLFSLRIGRKGEDETVRGRWLVIAIVANLLLLGWYKYLFPLLSLFERHGLIHHSFGDVVLPLGISFFTFTQIVYLVDLRQDVAKPQGLLSYVVFATFFPHLIAGPIIHPREIMPQLERGRLRGIQADNLTLGLSWFAMGLAKKIFADYLANPANLLYIHTNQFQLADTWIGAYAYLMELYFDFSGYSDMALGLARIFGIEFPFNFNSPYKAASIIEYWQRWHMTLTRYLGDYLYTPILRSINLRRSKAGLKTTRKAQSTPGGYLQMVFLPVFATMFIAGIWHGAGIQFLVFGALHGIYLAVNHAWRLFTPKGHPLHAKLPPLAGVVLTMLAVLCGSVFFRAASMRDAVYILKSLCGLHGLHQTGSGLPTSTLWPLPIAAFIVWALPNTQEILGQLPYNATSVPSAVRIPLWKPNFYWGVALSMSFLISMLLIGGGSNFLYFQF